MKYWKFWRSGAVFIDQQTLELRVTCEIHRKTGPWPRAMRGGAVEPKKWHFDECFQTCSEREIQQQMLVQDEETLELRETFTSLQQEVEAKTKKLKKVKDAPIPLMMQKQKKALLQSRIMTTNIYFYMQHPFLFLMSVCPSLPLWSPCPFTWIPNDPPASASISRFVLPSPPLPRTSPSLRHSLSIPGLFTLSMLTFSVCFPSGSPSNSLLNPRSAKP